MAVGLAAQLASLVVSGAIQPRVNSPNEVFSLPLNTRRCEAALPGASSIFSAKTPCMQTDRKQNPGPSLFIFQRDVNDGIRIVSSMPTKPDWSARTAMEI